MDKSPGDVKAQVHALRGMIHGAAEKQPLPKRFKVICTDGPQVIIRDIITDREVTVGLCDYLGARRVLNGLFPD